MKIMNHVKKLASLSLVIAAAGALFAPSCHAEPPRVDSRYQLKEGKVFRLVQAVGVKVYGDANSADAISTQYPQPSRAPSEKVSKP
jgi:hypothetical protein